MLYYHYIALPTQNISNIPKTTLYAWGLNSFGQLGDGTTINRSTPVSLNAQFSPTSSTGNNHTAIVYSDGSLYMTGFNQYGQLGDGTTINKSAPVKIGSSSWTSVTAQADSTVGLTIAGTLWSWGRNSFGELGTFDAGDRSSPVQISAYGDSASYASWAAVSVGQLHSLAIRKSDYSLWGWGLANQGQIGDGNVGTVSYRSKPVLISKSRSWSIISAGTNFSAAIDTTGALYMWGLGTSGQLGDNTSTTKYAPTKIGNSSWSTVSTGQIHTIAIDSTGALYAWGFNSGALGDNTASIRSSPVKIGSSSWSKINAANSYSAAIDTVGRLFTWGLNANGQLGDGTTITKSSPVQIGTSSWSSISVGNSQAFAVTNLGTLYAWGSNSSTYLGGLGDGTGVDKSSPVVINTVASYSSWRIVSASDTTGANFTLAIRNQDSSLWAWGNNTAGQLGDGTVVSRSFPIQIGTSSWSTVNAGNSAGFGVTSDGKLYAWGLNAAYQLGDGTTVSKSSPVQVGALNTFSTFAAQFNGNNYLSTPNTVANQPGSGDFTIEAWLNTTYSSNIQTASLISQYNTGALGEWNLGFQQNLLRAIVGQSTINDVSVPICDGAWHHIAWVRNGSGTNNNTVYVDGRAVLQFTNTTTLNGNAQPLYIGEAVSAGGSKFTGSVSNVRMVKGTAVYTSDFNTLSVPLTAIANTALLTCQSSTFIDNSTNAFTITNQSAVTSVLNTIRYPLRSSNSWTAVNAGDSHTTAIGTDGSLWTWGSNTFGQLGNFINQSLYTVPTKLPNSATPYSWAQISEGVSHTLAISNTGLLYGWGGNASGQLGDGTTITKSSPVLISAKSWSKVSAGWSHSVAIDSLGGLYAWGSNATYGQLGDGTTVSKSDPIKIGTSSWSSISAGQFHSMAIDTTGGLWSWGDNTSGKLGDGTVVNKSSPVLISSGSSWTSVSAGFTHSTAIDINGKLYAWGYNAQGQVGYLNGFPSFSTPTQIANSGGTYSWTQVSSGQDGTTSAGIAADGSLFTWGPGGSGRLGDGTTTDKNVPVKIGNRSWTLVTVGTSHLAAIDTTGALYAWGNNANGELGDGTTINKSSPVKIGTSSWSSVSAGGNHLLGITSTGALFGWGSNFAGQLGDNTLVYKSSPVAIGIPTGTIGYNSVLLNGTNQYLTTANYIDSTYTCTGNFTVEGWFYPTSVTGAHSLFTLGTENTGRYTWLLNGAVVNSNLYGASSTTYNSTVSINTWNHIAVVRSGSTVGVYLNGVLDATTDTQAGTIGNGALRIGADGTGSTTFTGNISNFRFVNGTAVYSGSSFTVPTQPISAIANTKLMTCQSSTITDITPVNSPTISNSVIPFTIPTTWTSVSVGYYHSVAKASDGSLYTWGYNNFGQLGDNSVVTKSTAVKIPTSAITYTQPVYWSKTAGAGGGGNFATTYGIRSNGSLWSWGSGNVGQLGDNTIVSKSSPIQIGTSSWTQVAAGLNHAIAIDTTGALYAWGNPSIYGTLGDGTAVAKSSPVKIGTSSWASLGAGYVHNAAIDINGRLYTWGNNSNGQLGNNSATNLSAPNQVGTSSWSMAAAGNSNTAAIDTVGRLFTWGYGNNGNLGDGTTVTKSSPVLIGSSSWTKVAVGNSNSMAIDINGGLYTWGGGSSGQLGDSTTVQRSTLTKIGTSSWSMVSAGPSHCAAIDAVGRLFTWGNNATGQLGDGQTVNQSSPVLISTSSWAMVYASQSHTSAIDVTGRLAVWGQGTVGAIGDGTIISKSSPVVLAAFTATITQSLNSYTSWSKISAGNNHTAAIDSFNSLYTWGYNINGQLSDGTTVNKSSPVAIIASQAATWKQISQNEFFTLGIRNQDSSLWAWGRNIAGALGDGTTIDKSSPVKIGTSSWAYVSAGNSHSAAIDTTGALYAWGSNTTYGQLGDGTVVNKSSPVKIGTGSWTRVAAGNFYTSAIDSTGKMWSWGNNPGDGTAVNKSTPVAVSLSGNWKKVSISQHALAIDSTGGLWAWGANLNGQIGNGTVNSGTANKQYSAMQIGTSSWATIAACRSSSAGITVDGRLFTWGSNDASQLGDITNTQTFNHKSSPVQIGTDKSWTALGATDLNCAGFSAIDTSGRLYYWGSSLGQGNSPVQMGAGNSFVMSSQGWTHLLAIDTVGRLWGLLSNDKGQLGDGTTVGQYTAASPVQVGNSSWSFVRAGYSSSSAIDINGRLFTWGANSSYELGDGTTIGKSSPVQIGIDRNWIFAKTALASCAIDSTNTLWHWGYNSSGLANYNTNSNNVSPIMTTLPNLSGLSPNSIEITQQNILAYNSSGSLYAWGDNTYGQIGDGSGVIKSSPVFVKTTPLAPSTQSWTSLNAGPNYAWAISNLGNLYQWSSGGALSQVSNKPSTVPLSNKIAIDINQNAYAIDNNQNLYQLSLYYNNYGGSLYGFGPKVSSISAGHAHYMIIDTLSRLWVWGTNAQGQLGDGTITAAGGPKRIPGVGASSWSKISAGSSYTMGITVSGELYGWGLNLNGQLGIGNQTNQSTPQKIGTSSWAMVATGKSAITTLAIDINGRLFAWGSGYVGQNGTNGTQYSSPVQMGVGTSWTTVSINQSHVAAIDTLGRLYTWGASYSGGLGNGQTFIVTPTQIYGTNSYTQVSTGYDYTMAIDTTGALYVWGQNSDGRLGDGTIISRSSPTKIGTSSWIAIDAGYTQPVAIALDGTAYSAAGTPPYAVSSLTALNVNSTTVTYSSWSFVNAGGSTQSAIDTTGSLYMWGYQKTLSGYYTFIPGTYGLQSLVYPTKIVSTNSWSSISTGSQHVAAITSTGSLFTWGYNGYGNLGDNTTVDKTSPVQIGTSSWSAVAVNMPTSALYNYTTGILSDGSLYSWGSNQYGQLADYTTVSKSSPVLLNSVTDALTGSAVPSWTFIETGDTHTAALTTTGVLWAWGLNTFGQLGDNTTNSRSAAVKIGTSSWTTLSAGGAITQVIHSNGNLYGWGRNAEGQLGDRSNSNRSSPVVVIAYNETLNVYSSWSAVSAGNYHTAAIDSTGGLYAWGQNAYGNLGNNTTVDNISPVKIGTNSWSKVGAGWFQTMGIDNAGRLYGWGYNGVGQLGDNTVTTRSSPVQIGTSSWSAVAVSVSNSFAAAITSAGNLFTWGFNTQYQLGDGTTITRSSPVAITIYNEATYVYSSWSAVSAGGTHTAAITSARALFAWGLNNVGQLGDGTTINKLSPVLIASGSSWTSVSAGAFYTTAIGQYGRLYAWGLGTSGQLGDGTQTTRSSPVLIEQAFLSTIPSATWSEVLRGTSNTIAIRAEDFSLWTWGYNGLSSGHLGDGTTVSKSSPVLIGNHNDTPTGYRRWNKIAIAGGTTTFYMGAIDSTGALYMWGQNTTGQLGDGTVVTKSSPVQIGASSWSAVSIGWSHAAAIDSVGRLFTWGDNVYGQLGDSTRNVSKSSPVLIGSSSWSAVSAGDLYTAAIDINGRLYIWGLNIYGAHGDGTTIDKSSPVQIGTSSWAFVSAGNSVTAAIDSVGRLFTWGYNTGGWLGDNTGVSKSSPVQIGTSSWTKVAAAKTYNTAAIDINGRLFSWGSLFIGDNQTSGRSSPVQIGTSSWTKVTSGNGSSVIDINGNLWAWGENNGGGLGDGTTVAKSSPVQIAATVAGAIYYSWTAVSAGLDSAFALNNLGRLYAWGNNATNQLGDGTITLRISPIQIGSSSWSAVSAGGTHTAAIDTTGTLYGWGFNTSGQVGDGTAVTKSLPTLANNPPYSYNTTSWSYVGLSNAIDSTGALYAWGVNASGQLGDGTTTNRSVPIKIGSSSWSVVDGNSFSNNNNLGLDINGRLFTWGLASSYQLGDVTTTNKSSPVQIGLDTVVTDTSFNLISSGTGNFFYGRGISGSLYGWGNNSISQLGISSGINPFVNNPQRTLASTNFYNTSATWRKISLGASHTMAIDTTGGLWVWGLNTSGQLGDNTIVSKSSPVKIGSSSWTFVKASHFISIAITTQGALYAWGFNDRGNPANASAGASTSSPVLCYAGSSFSFVGTNSANNAGGTAYCSTFLLNQNGVATFTGYSVTGENGNNTSGGFGSTTNQPLTGSSWTIVDVGGGRTGATPGGYVVGITTAGALYAWGDALSGALGDGTVTTKTSWVNKIGNSSWAFVQASSNRTTVGIDIQGRLFMWGDNTWGSLGDGTTINKSSPVQVGNSSWVSVSASFGQILAVDSSGRLFAWGLNSSGQMGDGTTINKSSPVQISVGKSNWISVATGQGHSAAIDSANTLYTWGLDSNGQLGNLR
jgi:alpha-tubulin suppressor-like RCC1 family protein